MGILEKLNIGIVGLRGRGKELALGFHVLDNARIHAVCDIDEDSLHHVALRFEASEEYTNYEAMIQQSDIDAVVIATPMPLHVSQSVTAIGQGLHVLSEVPAGVSVEECKKLAIACRESRRIYAMAENFVYYKPNVIVRELVQEGLFGTVYYASAEYLDEYKANNEKTPWRRKWQTGINGITYGTHSLGPLLQWMSGDRIVSVCCEGSGHHYQDPRGDYYENEDSCVMLGRMRNGGLINLRHDMLSDRPHAPLNNGLQGVDGCYESSRVLGDDSFLERNRVWLRSRSKDMETWVDLSSLEDEFLPIEYRYQERIAQEKGCPLLVYLPVVDFVEAITEGKPPAIGIDEAMDMTLPCLVSQDSIKQDGAWLQVPDSRDW